jgi:hypothetical protein
MRNPYPNELPGILVARRLPFRLSRQQLADLLQFRDKDSIGILVAKRMLPPLGNPPKGAPLWFATSVVLKLAENVKWLDRATRIVREYVKEKNAGDNNGSR